MRSSSRLLAFRTAPLLAAGLAIVALVVVPGPSAHAAAVIGIPAAPALSVTTALAGDTLVATSRYANTGTTAGVLSVATQTIRRPGQPHDHPSIWDGDFTNGLTNHTIAAGTAVQIQGSLVLGAAAPTGTWEAYASWRDAAGVWRDGPSSFFTVTTTRPTPVPPIPVPAPTPTPIPTPTPVATPQPAPPTPVAVTPEPPSALVVAQDQTPITVTPAPPARRTLGASDAQQLARAALKRVFKTAYVKSSKFRVTCASRSRTTRRCTVTWRYKGFRYRGTVLVQLTGLAHTTLVDVRRARQR